MANQKLKELELKIQVIIEKFLKQMINNKDYSHEKCKNPERNGYIVKILVNKDMNLDHTKYHSRD